MYCYDESGQLHSQYVVSTSSFGVGNQNGSYKTPPGEHIIAQKIGAGCPVNEVFIGRQPQGVLQALMDQGADLPKDIITSRILWLQGQEEGINKGEAIDSFARYIYIHGTSEEDKIGIPASHGCVRMLNSDIVELFEQVDTGCRVLIQEKM